jgi:hypothetical protein
MVDVRRTTHIKELSMADERVAALLALMTLRANSMTATATPRLYKTASFCCRTLRHFRETPPSIWASASRRGGKTSSNFWSTIVVMPTEAALVTQATVMGRHHISARYGTRTKRVACSRCRPANERRS